MKTYFECWVEAATALFSQALSGEPKLSESRSKPPSPGAFGWAATLSGDVRGRFSVVVDGAVLEMPLLGEGVEQKAGWMELLREAAAAAAGSLLARAGKKCQVASWEEISAEAETTHAFQLRSGERAWTILVRDEVEDEARDAAHDPASEQTVTPCGASPAPAVSGRPPSDDRRAAQPSFSPGLQLLLDVELEASLRFGSREMPLGEILDLGPGDMVELDRHVADPVDLIVGDKIVARGEVVLVNGNFGLRVTEVAAPRKRLESIRCLF